MNPSYHHSGFHIRYVVILGTFVQAFVDLSCNDSLPPYTEPANVLRAYVRNISPPQVYYSYVDINNMAFAKVTISPPQTFFIDIVNTFDEVLQDRPEVSGTFELVDPELPEVKATIPISVANLSGPQYDTTTKILTLIPGDTLKLRCSWDYKTDSDIWAFEKAYVVSYLPHNPRGTDVTHAPMNFSMMVRVKLFKATNAITSEKKLFQLLFYGYIIPSG